MREVGFGELVGRMVWGTDQPDAAQGIIRTIDVDGDVQRRVIRDGYFLREELSDGTVTHIVGPDATWFWDYEDKIMRVRRNEDSPRGQFGHAPIGGLTVGGHRPSWERWEGVDFTRPCSPVERTLLLGRDCYTVELAPPSHKPYPLRITVDALTGLVLRSENAGFGYIDEWTSVSIGKQIPAGTFEWDGPAEPLPSHAQQRAHREAEWQADQARDRRWLDDRGFGSLEIPARTDIALHERDGDTGAIHASVEVRFNATLLRRPTSSQEWDEPNTVNYPHDHRWSDERWDWYLASRTVIRPADLELIKASLRLTT